ncbi:hypothetical protein PENTCL1PPCAC_9910, partial [Pristionchus entomophagus]
FMMAVIFRALENTSMIDQNNLEEVMRLMQFIEQNITRDCESLHDDGNDHPATPTFASLLVPKIILLKNPTVLCSLY